MEHCAKLSFLILSSEQEAVWFRFVLNPGNNSFGLGEGANWIQRIRGRAKGVNSGPSGIIKTKKEVFIKNNVILDKITSDICVFMST